MEKKVALVTGASRGIGREIALKLAQKGTNIVINYVHNKEKAEETAREIEKYNVETLVVKADVSIFDDVKNMVDKAIEKFGSIDILVNNAGITRDALIMRMKEEDFDKVIQVNLKGAYNCIKSVSRIMMKKRSGRIISISSVVGLIGNVGQINYAAAKAGLIGMTKTAAKELAPRNITVNAVAPGMIETEMTDKLNDKVKEEILKNIPLNRFGSTSDIANAVAFLASDEVAYITAQVINVNGGMA